AFVCFALLGTPLCCLPVGFSTLMQSAQKIQGSLSPCALPTIPRFTDSPVPFFYHYCLHLCVSPYWALRSAACR
ncbi:MAG: hypothetical protein MJZ75_07325, partial [Paludibacteraceae bacterium]|nr:hypothetical protein [Paludibacteraceae bacterium]